MKKIFTLAMIAGMFSLVACGPSAEQKAADEKRIGDSTAAAESAMQAAEEAATAAAATIDTAMNKVDSTVTTVADSVKNHADKAKKTGDKMMDKAKGK